MKIVIKKENNLVVMLGNNIQYTSENNNGFFYSINEEKPWEVQKIYIIEPNDFEIIDITGLEIPDDNIEFKYEYNSETNTLEISDIWVNNQFESY